MLRSGRSGRFDGPYHGISEDSEHGELLTPAIAPLEVAFRELFESVYPDLLRYLVRRFGSDGAEDICSETFATVFSRWSDAPESLVDKRRWTFGIAHHKLQDAVRQRARRAVPAVPADTRHSDTTDFEDGIAASDRLRRLLDALPPGERDAVYLTVIEGFSSVEAGMILGCTATSVTSRVHRARAKLIGILNTEEEVGDDVARR